MIWLVDLSSIGHSRSLVSSGLQIEMCCEHDGHLVRVRSFCKILFPGHFVFMWEMFQSEVVKRTPLFNANQGVLLFAAVDLLGEKKICPAAVSPF